MPNSVNYTCECVIGFSGERCETEINPCDNNSCENGASCNKVVGSITNYTCECPTGFRGEFCELEIDPCANNSCANGATCKPMPNSVNYTCECVIGFSGERCKTGLYFKQQNN
ncbi:fibropellin-3-like [Strongylocentrotus purpuratus]|uniref:EGF-like domain-containing protein n=1 Tax=Strongylocentrotus purpuratus TaxID=7668 RepID=A0A7M7PAK6_STRPU|nr:fibropellin-3-like [Strongylocentrotus purpuratus]